MTYATLDRPTEGVGVITLDREERRNSLSFDLVVPLIERLDEAYARKYDMAEVFGDELPEWRYYRVVQRQAADR